MQTRWLVSAVVTKWQLDLDGREAASYTESAWGTQIEQFATNCNLEISYEGWNFNSGNYLFTTDTK